MYAVFLMTEKVSRRLRIFFKKTYYKTKYGKRLTIGKNVCFRKGFVINISKNGSLIIGSNTFFNNYCSINCRESIRIGENNLFGEGVKIYDHNHVFNDKRINIKKEFKSKKIVIGNRNWFGSNVIVLSGAKVGDYNVFGAGTIIASEYGSGIIAKADNKITTEKIHFKEDRNE